MYIGKIGGGAGTAGALALTGSTIGWYPVIGLALVVAGFIIARIAYRHRREIAASRTQ
ncbi:MAG TPA: peptidase [Microbacteriaceae bacterium]|jgi:hypothetical protein|nr:peptidase [Microbacteriaceae bacterium]